MPTPSKIYTKTGDGGSTRLVDGSSVEKFNPRVEAYGTVDELNSQLGECRHRLSNEAWVSDVDGVLEAIQNQLFNVGSLLASGSEATAKMLPSISEEHVKFLEGHIDNFDEQLPPLKNFILPAGHPGATALHMARTICRRAERRCAEIPERHALEARCLVYLNRLSDFLFVAARWVNMRTGRQDVIWKAP